MPQAVGFRLENKEVLVRQLRELGGLGPQALGRAMKVEAEEIMAISKEVFVPVETGNLKTSASIGEPLQFGNSVKIEMGYGNAAASYALAVHEIPPPAGANFGTVQPGEQQHWDAPAGRTARHGADIGKPGGQSWKYLERPFLARAQGMEFRLAKRLYDEIQDAV